MSLLFMGFVFIMSSLVILYSDDYMFGDLNIFRWCGVTVCDLETSTMRPLRS